VSPQPTEIRGQFPASKAISLTDPVIWLWLGARFPFLASAGWDRTGMPHRLPFRRLG
jgi:hypothetical protein